MQDSIFTKIIKGELPCHKIYEDNKTIAFLTIQPYIEGHTLVVPKLQIDDFEQLPTEDYQALFTTVQKVAKRIKDVFNVPKTAVTVLGMEIPHAHVHIMPVDSEASYFEAIENRATIPNEPDHQQLALIAERLRF
ncbi:HIT domain-containing protein [Candidatus Saccharibacteria bacterium]|nr:HIT domain-containing protein [Candidatus Saccharibacteria bacterium]